MDLSLRELNEYRRMSDKQRQGERGCAIRAEIDHRMRWMPKKWRVIVQERTLKRRSIVRTCMELSISKTTYFRRTAELAEWLEDTDKYLEGIV